MVNFARKPLGPYFRSAVYINGVKIWLQLLPTPIVLASEGRGGLPLDDERRGGRKGQSPIA